MRALEIIKIETRRLNSSEDVLNKVDHDDMTDMLGSERKTSAIDARRSMSAHTVVKEKRFKAHSVETHETGDLKKK